MIVCKKCGVDNDPGRVFCSKCGDKLSFDGVTAASVSEHFKKSFVQRYWRLAVYIVLAIIAVNISLALWSKTDLLGSVGTSGAALRVQEQLDMLANLKKVESVDVALKETDLNAFLKFRKIKKLNVHSASVDVQESCVLLRVVKTAGPYNMLLFKLRPTISLDYVLIPGNGQLYVRSVSMGHLKLIGPAKSKAMKSFYSTFGRDSSIKGLSDISAVRCEDDSIIITKEN